MGRCQWASQRRVSGAKANKLRTKKREVEAFSSCEEATTFNNTYTGVRFRPTLEVPLIQATEKALIFKPSGSPIPGEDEEDGENPWSRGTSVPLFWQECKPIQFWLTLLKDLNIKAVFDLSPGSGALAEAVMSIGALCHGVCRYLGLFLALGAP